MAAKKYTQEELDTMIEAARQKVRNKFRARKQRLNRAAKFAAVAATLAFAYFAANSKLELRGAIDHYRAICSSARSGQSLEAMRSLASESRLFFDEDPDRNLNDDAVFVLRPAADWPYRLGCRFVAREAKLYPLRP